MDPSCLPAPDPQARMMRVLSGVLALSQRVAAGDLSAMAEVEALDKLLEGSRN